MMKGLSFFPYKILNDKQELTNKGNYLIKECKYIQMFLIW